MKRLLFVFAAFLPVTCSLWAQSGTGLWTSAGVKKDMPKGMNAEFDAEWRQTGFFTGTDRWSIGASVSKRLYRNKSKSFNIKADLGYKYLSSNRQAYTIDKRDPELFDQEDGMSRDYYIENGIDFKSKIQQTTLTSCVSKCFK